MSKWTLTAALKWIASAGVRQTATVERKQKPTAAEIFVEEKSLSAEKQHKSQTPFDLNINKNFSLAEKQLLQALRAGTLRAYGSLNGSNSTIVIPEEDWEGVRTDDVHWYPRVSYVEGQSVADGEYVAALLISERVGWTGVTVSDRDVRRLWPRGPKQVGDAPPRRARPAKQQALLRRLCAEIWPDGLPDRDFKEIAREIEKYAASRGEKIAVSRITFYRAIRGT